MYIEIAQQVLTSLHTPLSLMPSGRCHWEAGTRAARAILSEGLVVGTQFIDAVPLPADYQTALTLCGLPLRPNRLIPPGAFQLVIDLVDPANIVPLTQEAATEESV